MGFFKAYDMRGTYGRDFDLALIYDIGKALPGVLNARRIVVGCDTRITSPAISRALIEGLVAAGAKVENIQTCTTPMVYFYTAQENYDAGIMVTASHNPPGDNGLKVSAAGSIPVGYDDGLNRIEAITKPSERIIKNAPCEYQSANPSKKYIERYVEWQKEAVPFKCEDKVRYAVDCSNGSIALLAKDLFPGAALLNDTPDGNVPAHSPNPLKAEAREQIAEYVRQNALDFGIVFDGDADRAIFVDEQGNFVQPDYLTPIVAKALAKPGDKVIYDVRTSRGSIEALREAGFVPEMVPVGHVFAKKAMRGNGAVCGGELAGHYYFRQFFCCDSAVFAARHIINEAATAKYRGLAFSQMVAPISSRYANSGELNFCVEDKAAATKRALDAAARLLGKESARSEIDGFRLDYDDGWFSIRKSNTEPYLRLVAEFSTREMLDSVVATISHAIGGNKE